MKKLKLNLDQLKNTEVLTRDQLRKVLGGMAFGSGGSGTGSGGCISDEECSYMGTYHACINSVCEPYLPGSTPGCGQDTPRSEQCVNNHYGCCPSGLSCVYGAGGWECFY